MRKIYISFLTIACTAILFLVFYPHVPTSPAPRVLSETDVRNQPFQTTIDYKNSEIQPLVLDATSTEIINTQAFLPLDELKNQFSYTLSIPSLSINAPVILTGLEPGGRMAVPENFKEIGLFNGASQPGEPGTAIMGAHVDNGGNIPGVFKHLSNLKKGETLVVKDVHNKTFVYKVTDIKVYNKDAQADDVFAAPSDGMSRLNLITCYGTWLPQQSTYSDRLVVFTQLINVEQPV